jgi:putative protease
MTVPARSPLPRLARLPEVLAPAGDAEAMRAAVAAGADAVYFGLVGTSARARAKNFDVSELAETMRVLHGHSVRGYVALNTLVFDAELARLEEQVRACAAAAVDAVIVQDIGVAQLVRAIAPGLAIHASTQMTCTDAAAVQMAKECGANRVILARELSLDDIAAIRRATDVELEVFVHGALCIAYSGQCLTSEAIGGRSANRGACAQACRLPYELVVDGVVRDLGDRAHLLSPEDLEASALVPDLARLGVVSLKIEGRLKGPEYVAATTTLYRRAVDAFAAGPAGVAPTEEDRATALQMFTRGSGPGFFRGVDHQRLVEGRTCDHRGLLAGTSCGLRTVRGKRCVAMKTAASIARGDGLLVEGEPEVGGRVWAIYDGGLEVEEAPPDREIAVWLGPDRRVEDADHPSARVWKTSDPAREKQALAPLRSPHRVRLDVRVHGAVGELPVFDATTERGGAVTVRGEAPIEQARTHATTAESLREKLGRLGETGFVLGELEVDLPPDVMVPLSTLNRARRAITEALAAPVAQTTSERTHVDLLAAARTPDRPPPAPGLFVLCRTLAQAEAALDAGADGVYLDFLDLVGTGNALRALRARPSPVHVTLAAPRIRKPGEEKIDRYLAQLAPDALLVRSLGSLHDGGQGSLPQVADFSLNVTNRLAAAAVLARNPNVAAFTPSFDLDADQLTALLDPALAPFAEVVLHHPMPLFHMEHCVIAALLSNGGDHKTCGRPCDRHAVSLRDRAGVTHPVEADVGCRNTVFHGAAQSAASLVPALTGRGVRRFRIELVREPAAEVGLLVGAYRSLVSGRKTPAEIWRDIKTMSAGASGGYGVVKGSLRVIA